MTVAQHAQVVKAIGLQMAALDLKVNGRDDYLEEKRIVTGLAVQLTRILGSPVSLEAVLKAIRSIKKAVSELENGSEK